MPTINPNKNNIIPLCSSTLFLTLHLEIGLLFLIRSAGGDLPPDLFGRLTLLVVCRHASTEILVSDALLEGTWLVIVEIPFVALLAMPTTTGPTPAGSRGTWMPPLIQALQKDNTPLRSSIAVPPPFLVTSPIRPPPRSPPPATSSRPCTPTDHSSRQRPLSPLPQRHLQCHDHGALSFLWLAIAELQWPQDQDLDFMRNIQTPTNASRRLAVLSVRRLPPLL